MDLSFGERDAESEDGPFAVGRDDFEFRRGEKDGDPVAVVLVQGSASDETKEALIRYSETANGSRMLLQVHDELVITCHKQDAEREMANLKRCMTGLELDVPMLSEGEWGYRWGDMKEFRE